MATTQLKMTTSVMQLMALLLLIVLLIVVEDLQQSLSTTLLFSSTHAWVLTSKNRRTMMQMSTPTSSSLVAAPGRKGNKISFVMRDASASYWFKVGDSVRVIEPVKIQRNTIDLYHRVGEVVETWEKCDVDPTCCCAEQVDINMAVRVKFPKTEEELSKETDDTSSESSPLFWVQYFGEAELEHFASS